MSELTVGLMGNLVQLNQYAEVAAEELWLCSAYLSRSGLDAIKPIMHTANQVKGIFGAGPLTDPEAVRTLLERKAEVRLFPHSIESEFHPKCYMGVRKDGQAWAAVGSANLTGRGAAGNVELLATVLGPVDHPFFNDLTDWLLEIQSFAVPSSEAVLAFLKALHSNHLEMVSAMQEAHGQLAVSIADIGGSSDRMKDFWSIRLCREALVSYIIETKLFASYKLVILGLLLNCPQGRMPLAECARAFHWFYQSLQEAGVYPERTTGNPPPHMLKPDDFSLPEVEAIILKEPKRAFANTGNVVVYGTNSAGRYLSIARVLWNGLTQEGKQVATEAVVERLEEYYQKHIGSYFEIRPAFLSAIKQIGTQQ